MPSTSVVATAAAAGALTNFPGDESLTPNALIVCISYRARCLSLRSSTMFNNVFKCQLYRDNNYNNIFFYNILGR